MIQRIQSLFLLVSVILLGILISNPFAAFTVEPQMLKYSLTTLGLSSPDNLSAERIHTLWFLFAFLLLVLLISLITIFLYRKRMLQIRLCIITIVMLVGVQGVMFYIVNAIGKNLNTKPQFSIVFIFPLVSAILNFLALRAIARDEALIRSLDRLR